MSLLLVTIRQTTCNSMQDRNCLCQNLTIFLSLNLFVGYTSCSQMAQHEKTVSCDSVPPDILTVELVLHFIKSSPSHSM